MATWNEIVYMVIDKLKIKSDDANFNEDHIKFLMINYRSLILKQRYTDLKKDIPESNYQTICVDIENNHDCITGDEVKSIQKIPEFTNTNGDESIKINPIGDIYNTLEYVLTSPERFPYLGHNKWLHNIVYFTLHRDNHLYLKSQNTDFKYMKRAQISAMFDDPLEAAQLSCNEDSIDCEYMDSQFPLETSLVPVLIDMIVGSLSEDLHRPEDKDNDANDNLSDVRVRE